MQTLSPISIRRLVVLIALLLPLAACSSSKDTGESENAQGSDQRIERQLAAIDEAVDLTDDQTARIREILIADEASRPSGPPRARQGGQAGESRVGGADRRVGRQARRADMDQQIEALLTEAQVEQYRAWRAAQPERPRRGQRRGGSSSAP